jgi:hypothetical protein
MNRKNVMISLVLSCVIILGSGKANAKKISSGEPSATLGITEGISSIDPRTEETTTFASGLPKAVLLISIGGASDIAFIDEAAYVLITFIGSDLISLNPKLSTNGFRDL